MNGLNILKQPYHKFVKPLAARLEQFHPDAIACKAARRQLAAGRNERRAVVVYDSETGSTWKIAKAIAEGLGCEAKRITEVTDLSHYELAVFGSPSVDKCPTATMRRFLEMTLDRPPLIAFFCTFSEPVPGQLATLACLRNMACASGRKPTATFSCPGSHLGSEAHRNRPSNSDQRNAFLFGLRLAKRLKRK